MKSVLNNRKKYINCVLFIVLFLISIIVATRALSAKEPGNKDRIFLNNNCSYDVMFFGSSHAENFFDPMRLWRKYDITSYNFGNPEEPLPVTYWVMENAFSKSKPKIAVVDLYMLDRGYDSKDGKYFHYGVGPFSMSKTKIAAAGDLSNDLNGSLDKLFPLSTYHSRWKDIGKEENEDINYFMNGCLSYGHPYTMNIEPYDNKDMTSEISQLDENSEDVTAIKRMINLCNNNGIEIIFTSTPYVMADKEEKDINAINQLLNREGVLFINYNKPPYTVDKKIDMYNVGHVNQSGLRKVTDFFGSYIVKNYSFKEKSEKDRMLFDQLYEDYQTLKYESLWAADKFEQTLMLIHDENYKTFVYVKDARHLSSETRYRLMQNIYRDDVTIDNMNEVSYDMNTLNFLDYAIDEGQSYLLFSNEDGGFTELMGEEADNIILEQCSELDIKNACIVVKDLNNTTKIIKNYTLNGEELDGETVLTDFNTKYLF